MAERSIWHRLWRKQETEQPVEESAVMQNEFAFVLPRGYLDAGGRLHRHGRMRLAFAHDEMEVASDPRVQANTIFLPALLLSRVIVQLGQLSAVTPEMMLGLFAVDLAFLEDLYQRINSVEATVAGATCPQCGCRFQLQLAPLPLEEMA